MFLSLTFFDIYANKQANNIVILFQRCVFKGGPKVYSMQNVTSVPQQAKLQCRLIL